MKDIDRICEECNRYIEFIHHVNRVQLKVYNPSIGYYEPEVKWGHKKAQIIEKWDKIAKRFKEEIKPAQSFPKPIVRVICSGCIEGGLDVVQVFDTPKDFRRAPRTGYIGKRK